jgi:tetratricopeptide (TPR) repeat protein
MKVAVYTIALNEAAHVERWYESSRDADYHLILDTGSTDDTVQIARDLGITVLEARVFPWRFDLARNTAMALLPSDIDYCVSMDMDEILMPGWRSELEKAYEAGATLARLMFTFSFNPDGTPGFQFGASRIHARNGYIWKYPIHEVIAPYQIEEKQFWTGIEMQHHPDRTKSREQYMPMLEAAVRSDPLDARLSFYYGRELMYHGRNREAVQELERFLSLPTATWVGDRSDAMLYISKCVADPVEARQWVSMSIRETPDRREGYVRMALLCYHSGEYREALNYAERAIAITDRPLQYMCEEWAWNWELWDVAAISAWCIGEKEKAVQYGEIALDLGPHVPRLHENMKYYSGKV